MLPDQTKIESVKLVDADREGGIEILYDDPSVKSPFTFPTDITFQEFMMAGRYRSEQKEKNRLATIEAARKAQEAAAAEALAQMGKEEAAKEAEPAAMPEAETKRGRKK